MSFIKACVPKLSPFTSKLCQRQKNKSLQFLATLVKFLVAVVRLELYDLRFMRKYSNFSPFYFHDSLILSTFFIYSIKAYIFNPFYFFKRLINILHFELLLTIHSLLSVSCNPTKIYGNIKYNNKSGGPKCIIISVNETY